MALNVVQAVVLTILSADPDHPAPGESGRYAQEDRGLHNSVRAQARLIPKRGRDG